MNPNVESKIKSWLFPGLVAILATIIWQDVKEIKNDVKALIAQSNQDKIRIDNLERQLYGKPVSQRKDSGETPLPSHLSFPVFMPVKQEDLYKLVKQDITV
jgi:hypothetical protein